MISLRQSEHLKKARVKAFASPLTGKRGKGKKTIEREERRKIFDEIVSQEFKKLIKKARPEYKIDQFMGKTPEVVETRVEVNTANKKEIEAIAKEAALILKKKKL